MESTNDEKIRIHYVDGAFLLDSIETIKLLRTKYRLVANPIIQMKPTIEALFVIDKYSVACLYHLHPQSLNVDSHAEKLIQEAQKESKFSVFLDLYKKGNYILSGSKYGADFAVYQDDPLVVHAAALVFVLEQEGVQSKFNLVELNRVSTIAKKECVIAHIMPSDDPSVTHQVNYERIARCAVSWHKDEEGRRRKKQACAEMKPRNIHLYKELTVVYA